MIARILPHPVLAAVLVVVWIMLVNALTPGSLVMGMIVATAVCKLTSIYWPERAKIGRPLLVAEYLGIVLYDIVVSSLQVARLILFRNPHTLRSQFITVPLDARTPEAIVALACTITLTPGTLSVDVSEDMRCLMVHCLDVADPAAAVEDIKQRYEQRLMRILT